MTSREWLVGVAVAAAVAAVAGCSSGSESISLRPGQSKTVHGVIEEHRPGPGFQLPCIHSGSLDGPKRCAPLERPNGPPKCIVRQDPPRTVDATLYRQLDGSYYWVITADGGQPC
ncbi:MAG: hypothetical protein QOG34_710 [Frankiaceae bacterium]|jgi:hypothetical protein|nr:hypothetical protein [Frankiaceae bacterium]